LKDDYLKYDDGLTEMDLLHDLSRKHEVKVELKVSRMYPYNGKIFDDNCLFIEQLREGNDGKWEKVNDIH